MMVFILNALFVPLSLPGSSVYDQGFSKYFSWISFFRSSGSRGSQFKVSCLWFCLYRIFFFFFFFFAFLNSYTIPLQVETAGTIVGLPSSFSIASSTSQVHTWKKILRRLVMKEQYFDRIPTKWAVQEIVRNRK